MGQQFVDETLLMGLPTTNDYSSFKIIMSHFSTTSSTTINQEKSKLFFFNTPMAI